MIDVMRALIDAMRAAINFSLIGKMIMESCLYHDMKHMAIVDNEMSVPYRSKNVAR